MDNKTYNALRRVLDYIRDDERRNWEEAGEPPSGHIYNDIVALTEHQNNHMREIYLLALNQTTWSYHKIVVGTSTYFLAIGSLFIFVFDILGTIFGAIFILVGVVLLWSSLHGYIKARHLVRWLKIIDGSLGCRPPVKIERNN